MYHVIKLEHKKRKEGLVEHHWTDGAHSLYYIIVHIILSEVVIKPVCPVLGFWFLAANSLTFPCFSAPREEERGGKEKKGGG